MIAVKHRSVPLGLKLHTTMGYVEIQPQVFAVMLSDENTLILETITLRSDA